MCLIYVHHFFSSLLFLLQLCIGKYLLWYLFLSIIRWIWSMIYSNYDIHKITKILFYSFLQCNTRYYFQLISRMSWYPLFNFKIKFYFWILNSLFIYKYKRWVQKISNAESTQILCLQKHRICNMFYRRLL